MRANFEAFELSVGNETATPGLLTACPAATLALRDFRTSLRTATRGTHKLILTAMKEPRSGGQEHGILTTCPAAFLIPSQSPVPVGFNPAWRPNWGTRLGSTPPEGAGAGDAGADAGDSGAGAEDAGAGAGAGDPVSGPAAMVCCWARKVVEAAGQPTPGPLRF